MIIFEEKDDRFYIAESKIKGAGKGVFASRNIKKDEFGNVSEIKEKNKISDLACVGAYCFSSGKLLMETIKKVLISGERDRNEYYVSDLYKNLIASGERVTSREITDFTCLGTPNQLKSFSSKLILSKTFLEKTL
jgi:dTDP-glucose pyrophosphorylase